MDEILRVLHKAMQTRVPVMLVLQFGSSVAEILEECEITGIGKDFITYQLISSLDPTSMELMEETVITGHIRKVGVPKARVSLNEAHDLLIDDFDDDSDNFSRFDLC